MELNHKALNKTIKMRNEGDVSSVEEIVAAYFDACNEPEQARPFDAALVKPGDDVICEQARHRKFVGMTIGGLVVTETPAGGMVQVWEPAIVTIPPKPKKTVKVRLFRGVVKPLYIVVIPEKTWGVYIDNPELWEPCSAIVEIEVTE